MLGLSNVIIGIHKNDMRLQRTNFLLVVLPITDNNNDITLGGQTSGSSIQADDTRTASTSDSIGFQASSIIDIDHLHLFIRIDVGGVQQILINGDTADVVEVGLRNCCAVNFPFAHCALHK